MYRWVIVALAAVVTVQAKQSFWHISDLHLDFYYDLNLPADKICPSSSGVPASDAGPWGDYRCDSPFMLIKSAIDEMAHIEPEPDFIIWTGDDTLHTNDEEKYLSKELVLGVISNLTDLIKQSFPNTTVLSALGNHDYHPKSQFPDAPSELIRSVAQFWKPWLGEEQFQQFGETGYYSGEVDGFPGLYAVVLNTNIWYTSNKQVKGTGDPIDHFSWLSATLSNIRHSKGKAYVIGHIPPGFFELVDYKYWYYPEYNAKFIDVIKEYSDVIVAQFFGHHHTDTFRMYYNNDGSPVSSLMIAPGVTPWMTTLPGADNGANNPGIRLFNFDPTTFVPTDYKQYYLDLKEANKNNHATWRLEYQATDAFGISDLSHDSWHKLTTKLEQADVSCHECEGNSLMQNFFLYNSVSYNKIHCDSDCQRLQVCAVRELDIEKYHSCVSNFATRSKFNLHLVAIFIMLCARFTASE